ncbi:MAG: YhbY family RNA-binding protein [Planctomycetia bacterium]|nr:MAG: YhbY family RNA-binding protein [Planctomycetia bacterium]
MLDGKTARALRARANRLDAALTVGDGEPSESVLRHVSAVLDAQELVKVRVSTDDRDACHRVAAQLAENLGCELVQVVGRVAVLYRGATGGSAQPSAAS